MEERSLNPCPHHHGTQNPGSLPTPWLPSYHSHLIYSPTLKSHEKKLKRRKELWEGRQESRSLLPKSKYCSSELTGLCRSWTTIHSPRTTTPSDNQQETLGTDNNGQHETRVDLSTLECIHSLSKMNPSQGLKKVQRGTYRLNTYLSVKQGISEKKIWNDLKGYFLDAICKHYWIAMDQNSTGKINK